MAGSAASFMVGLSVLALGCVSACGGDDTGGGGDAGGGGGTATGSSSANEEDASGGQNTSLSDAGLDIDLAPPPTAKLSSQVAGKACDQASDCAGERVECAEKVGGITTFGLSLNDSTTPGGYCTGDCLSDADCGEGGACTGALAELFAVGECQSVCTSDSDCREGYACLDLSALGELNPGAPKTCLPTPTVHPLEDNVAGKPCTDDAQCGGGFCARPFWDEAGSYAYCTGHCYTDDTCGAGAVCSEGAVATQLGTLPGSCEQPCEQDTDCTHPEHTCQGDDGGKKACRAPLLPPELFEDGGLFDPSLWDVDGGLFDPSLWDLGALFGDAGVANDGG